MPKITYKEKPSYHTNCGSLINSISNMYNKHEKELSSFELRAILKILREIEKYNKHLPFDKHRELSQRFRDIQKHFFFQKERQE